MLYSQMNDRGKTESKNKVISYLKVEPYSIPDSFLKFKYLKTELKEGDGNKCLFRYNVPALKNISGYVCFYQNVKTTPSLCLVS